MNSSTIVKRATLGSSTRIIQLILTIIVSFYMIPFLVRSLGTEKYGIWVLAGAFAGYYGFLDFGISIGTGRFMAKAFGAKDNKRANIISSSALAVYLCISFLIILVTMISFLCINYFGKNHAELFSTLVLILGFGLAIQFPARSFGTILIGNLRHDIISAVEIGTFIIRTILILIFVNIGHGLITLAIITTTMATLACILNLFFVKMVFSEYSVKISYIDKNTIKELFHYSKTMFIFTSTEIVKIRTAPFIIAKVVGVKILVIYTIASTFINYFKEIIKATTGMSYHIVSRFEGENNFRAIEKTLIYSTAIATIISSYIATSLIVYGKTFIILWMGEAFTKSYTILVILCVFESIVFSMDPSLSAFAGLSKHKINATLNVIDTTLAIMLGFILGEMYGIIGATIGITSPLIIKTIVIPYYTIKLFNITFTQLYGKIVLSLSLCTMGTIIIFNLLMRTLFTPTNYLDLILVNLIQPFFVIPFIYLILPNEFKSSIKRIVFLRKANSVL